MSGVSYLLGITLQVLSLDVQVLLCAKLALKVMVQVVPCAIRVLCCFLVTVQYQLLPICGTSGTRRSLARIALVGQIEEYSAVI